MEKLRTEHPLATIDGIYFVLLYAKLEQELNMAIRCNVKAIPDILSRCLYFWSLTIPDQQEEKTNGKI